jgi:serine/threonine protein kinase
MLTGQSPFSGCDEDELFWSICNERPFIPRYLSQEATDILVCLLEKDSGKRPPGHEIAVHAFFQVSFGIFLSIYRSPRIARAYSSEHRIIIIIIGIPYTVVK